MIRLRTLVAALLAPAWAACGAPATDAAPLSPAAPCSSAAPPVVESPPPPRVPAPLDPEPRVVAAVAAVTRSMLEKDLAVLAQPRHHTTAPAHLAAVASHLETELGAAGYKVTRQPVSWKKFTADNVVGERAGTDPSRVIVVSAHYDAVQRTPGADDNASGVAGVLAVARALGRLETKATLRAIGFAFEEQGLVGSAAYARSLSKPERDRIIGVVNMDMIAYRDSKPGSQQNALDEARPPELRKKDTGDFIAALALAPSPALLGALEAARSYVPDLKVETMIVSHTLLSSAPDLLRSDQASFWGVGVPAVSIVDTAEQRNPHYHRKTDTVSTLDLDFATDVVRWVTASVLLLDRT